MSTPFSYIQEMMHHGHVGAVLADRIRANIVRLRDERGWSRPELGRRLNPPTSGSQIERLEKGWRSLEVDWVEKIARALGVEPAELVADDDQRFTLTEQVAAEVALELARFVLRGGEPDQETVAGLAMLIQDLSATFADAPEARSDAQVARPVVRALARQRGRRS
jgi:transcriptional regulator with XRE-family HTH domain